MLNNEIYLSVGIVLLIYYSNVNNLKQSQQRILFTPLQKPLTQKIQNRETIQTRTLTRTTITLII